MFRDTVWIVGHPETEQFPITATKQRSRPLMAFGATINSGNGRERYIPFPYREYSRFFGFLEPVPLLPDKCNDGLRRSAIGALAWRYGKFPPVRRDDQPLGGVLLSVIVVGSSLDRMVVDPLPKDAVFTVRYFTDRPPLPRMFLTVVLVNVDGHCRRAVL